MAFSIEVLLRETVAVFIVVAAEPTVRSRRDVEQGYSSSALPRARDAPVSAPPSRGVQGASTAERGPGAA